MKKWTIYRHTAPNGKVYIGITCQKPEYRWGHNGKHYLEKNKYGNYSQPAFANAVLKYGWKNIVHEIILDNLTISEAVYGERYLIRWYKQHKISYNIGEGGDGVIGAIWTDERRKQVSIAMKKWHKTHTNPMLGRHHTDEARFKIKQNHKRYLRDETKKKISESLLGKPFSQERRQRLSLAYADKRIPVIQLTLNNEFVAEYISIMDACRATGIYSSAISAAVRRNGSAKGFKWRRKIKDDN